MAAGTFAPDPALPNSGFPVSIAQYDDDTKRQIVRAFAAYEMSGVDAADRIILGVVPEQLATDVERIAQIDIHGFDNVLQADGLRHGAKHDGRTGNKPVTPEDVAALLDIFDTYNNITVTSMRGETSIKLSKTGADGMTYVAVIGKKKGHIFTKNMWKGQTKGDGSFRRTDAHNAPASTPAAAANYEPSTDSLPENVQDGKGTTGFLPSTADATGRPQAQAREPMRANRADAAATPQGTAGVDVMDELVRGAGAVGAQETDGAGARAQSAMEAALAGTEEPGARPAGQGRRRYRAGVNRADTAGRLDASDRIQLRVLDGLGKKYGVKIVIEDTIRYGDGEGRVYAGTANAYYDRSDGTIHVALDAEGGAYLFFAVHELTHKLRAENADAYAALEAFVLNKLETSELYGALTQGEGGTLEERIASVRALYAARGQELSRGEAIEEIVCDAIPVILTDEQTVRELVRTDRTLAERIRDFFEEFYNELTRQLAGVVYGPGNRVEAAALMNDTETVRELAELFRMALESSADLQYELLTQSGSAIEEAGTAEHKRFSAKDDRAASIKEQIRAYAEKLNGMQAVAVIESGSRPKKNGHPDRLLERQELQRYYGNTTSSVDRQGFGRIEFDQNAIAQLVKYLNSDAEFAAAKAAPAVVKRGIEIDHHMEHKGRNDIESYTFAAPVVLNGKRGNEAVVVQRTNRNKPHAVRIVMPDGSGFDLDVNERNSPDTSERLPQRATVYGPEGTVSADSIHNSQEEVNSELPDLRFSRKAGEGTGSAIEEAGNDKRRGRRLSARADGEDAITMEDVAAIQSIGRKSVNAFSSDEIRTAEPFARRYWRELGVKSPFFRAWFGDWRANDRMPVQLVRVAGADAPKSGRAINADTGRPISWGDRLRSETWAHGTKNALESIKGIDRIIETAVLLDTIAANQTGKSKLPGTAFMHSLYSLVDDGNGLTLYRLFAEEAVPVGGGDPFTRAYELKEIKKVATAPYGVLSVSGGLTNGAPATTYTVADLFAFVKENVPDFQPKPVHPAMLNADGTPRAVRQGVDAAVEVLDGKTALQDGEAVYVKLENPYPAGTAAEVPGRAALEAGGYDGAVYQDGNGGTHYAVLDGTQLKSATDNAGTFDGRNPNLRFSQKADAGWAAYVSEEAQQRYAQDGRFQRWAHRDLAFISAASWDGVHIPADVLMQNPKIREAQELTEGRGSSLQKNLPGTNSLVDERRERLAQRLLNAEHGSAVFENGKIKKINGVEQFTGEVEQGRHACIVIGRPAGGKSRVFANPLSNRYKARILDADTVKPWLDGFDDGYGAGYVQDESSLIMEMAFEKAIARGDNVIIPKIGGGRIVDLANRMKSAGYTVDLYYNEVSEETSIMRAASRFAEEGRYLSLNYLLTIRNKPKETFTKWAESGIFDYAEWRNNDVGFGEEPRLVWRTGDGGLASVLGDAAELERTVGMGSSDAQRYRRDIPVSGGTEAGDREISGQVTGRKQIDSDTTEAPEEGAFFDALIQDTPRRYSARATTNDGAHRQSAEEWDAAPAVSEKVLGNVAKRILQRTGSGYSADRLTDGLKTLLHADAEQRRETADALARQVPIPRWQGLAVEKRTGIAYNGERKRAPCGGRGGPRGGVRGEMDACCKNRSNGWF